MLTTQTRYQIMRVSPRVLSTMVGAALSTKTQETVEGLLNKAHWHDVADEVKEVDHLLHEGQTNHAVDLPNAKLQERVDHTLDGIQHLVKNHPDHASAHAHAFSQVHTLKRDIKDELYHLERPSARYFSTDTSSRSFSTAMSAESQIDALEGVARSLHWSDVEDEAEAIRALLHEYQTNHAIQKPDAALIELVESTLQNLQQAMVRNPDRHGKNFARLHSLKGLVKAKLYRDAVPFEDHVAEFEGVMQALHWSDLEDEVEIIDHLMHEGFTNYAVRIPDENLKKLVDETLQDVQKLLVVEQAPSAKNHEEAFDRVHKLKTLVKSKLYKE